jgi:hypothetical protein
MTAISSDRHGFALYCASNGRAATDAAFRRSAREWGVTIMTAKAAETAEKSQPREVPDASVLSAVNWDDSKMATHFANVVNIQSTLEQVDLFFGTNQTWNVPSDRRVQVELNNRIILSPHAAKRLWLALGGVLEGYEARHGELRIEGR